VESAEDGRCRARPLVPVVPATAVSDTASFEVRIVNEAGSMRIHWSRNWSPWIDVDPAGRPDVEAAIHRLSTLGWDVEPESPT
jgi:hypothetical protein